MYEYIKGALIESAPTYVIVECNGVGYYIHISINTYSNICSEREVLLYIHQVVREDAFLLYGFFSREERTLFRALISVSGVGVNIANIMLSSMTVEEIASAISTENVKAIKSVKGVGIKTAQRIIIELKDKIDKDVVKRNLSLASAVKEEALAALETLGFKKALIIKVLDGILAEKGDVTVEELIKLVLKHI